MTIGSGILYDLCLENMSRLAVSMSRQEIGNEYCILHHLFFVVLSY